MLKPVCDEIFQKSLHFDINKRLIESVIRCDSCTLVTPSKLQSLTFQLIIRLDYFTMKSKSRCLINDITEQTGY